MLRLYAAIVAVLVLCAILWVMPLVRVVPLDDSSETATKADAKSIALHLWEKKLPETFSSASDAAVAVALLLSSPEKARRDFGTSLGVSRGFLLYLHGTGKVLKVEKKGVEVALDESDRPQLVLLTGMVFGSAVRDATGLMSTNEAETSQEFNDVSNELNQLVETRVIPVLAESVKIGDQIEFVGCVDVKDPQRVSLPLRVVPVSIKVE